jgi:hypothetical protein
MLVITALIIALKKENPSAFKNFISIFTVDECKTCWRIIRNAFKKINEKKMTGSAAAEESKYDRDNLKFLDSCLQDRQ